MTTTKVRPVAPRSTPPRRSEPRATTTATQTEPPTLIDHRKAHGLAIRLWQDDEGDEMKLELQFRTIAGGSGRLKITRDLRRKPKSVLSQLEARGAVLKVEPPLEALQDLLMTENPCVHRRTATPGWHHNTFVPARHSVLRRDAKGYNFRMRAAEILPTYVDRLAGTSKGWRRYVGAPSRQSTAMSFAILIALAAPLAARAGLSEGALFNFFQDSSVGETTLARVAASVAGAPARIGNWHTSKRGAEEYAAAHNGYALILDDTEKNAGDLAGLIRTMTHIITGGQSRTYSASVQDQLRPLTWFCFGLGTSPKSMSALARQARIERTVGEGVCLIDLPVPDQAIGGIFDRPAPGAGAIGDRARTLIDGLERGIAAHHGQLFIEWRKVFLPLAPEAIMERVAAVEAAIPAGDNLDGRLRRKFAIVRAAGELAVEHKILDWQVGFVAEVVAEMLSAAREEMRGFDEERQGGWRKLRAALADPEQVAPLDAQGRLTRPFEGLLGVRGQHRGIKVIAFNGDRVRALFGGSLEAFVAPLRDRGGVVREGRADTETVQFNIRVPQAGKPVRPRLYAVCAEVLMQVLTERAGVEEGGSDLPSPPTGA